MANDYDVVVIGSGTGGYVAAIRAAQLGLRTAVVERAPVLGGTCLNWGCIPTKALLEHAHALKIAQDWKEWGLTIGQAAIGLDMDQVQARKDKIVKGLTGGVELLFKKNKIDWIKGSGRLAGQGKVEITEGQKQTLAARKEIIVATGSYARSVPGIEIDRKRIISSDDAIGLTRRAEVDRDHGQRRRRRRVRVDLPSVRERRDDHRAAATAGADRGRGGVGGARAVFQEAGHQGSDRHEGDLSEARRRRRGPRGADPRRQDVEDEGRAACSSRPAAGRSLGPWRRGGGPGDGARLYPRRPSATRPACPGSPRSATSSPSTSPVIRSWRTSRRRRASRSPSG